MKEYKMIKKEKGITLIALVVTIVVLLILAAVSISMLTGENGVVTQAQNSKEETEQSKCEELVTVAINSLLTDNLGDRSKITPQDIAEEVNRMENRTDVVAEGNTFPTNILFTEENRKVGVNIEIGVTDPIEEEIYSEPGAEENIAPADLFDYEIINNGSTGSLKLSALPERTVRILGIKSEYCSGVYGGYTSENGEIFKDTNYEIILEDGTKILDTLVIPYQVDGKYVEGGIEGELYKVVEVSLLAYGATNPTSYTNSPGYSFPDIETVIYPNTIEKLFGYTPYHNTGVGEPGSAKTLKKVILPDSVTSIEENTFPVEGITINYTGTQEEWNAISGINNIPSNATINYNYTGE